MKIGSVKLSEVSTNIVTILLFGVITTVLGVVVWLSVQAVEERSNRKAVEITKEKRIFCQETISVIDTLRFEVQNGRDILSANAGLLHAVRYCVGKNREVPDPLGLALIERDQKTMERALQQLRAELSRKASP